MGAAVEAAVDVDFVICSSLGGSDRALPRLHSGHATRGRSSPLQGQLYDESCASIGRAAASGTVSSTFLERVSCR